MVNWIIWQIMAPNEAARQSWCPAIARDFAAHELFSPIARDSWQVLAEGERAFISRYALGRDYHKVLRNRLANWPIRFVPKLPASMGEYSRTAPR